MLQIKDDLENLEIEMSMEEIKNMHQETYKRIMKVKIEMYTVKKYLKR